MTSGSRVTVPGTTVVVFLCVAVLPLSVMSRLAAGATFRHLLPGRGWLPGPGGEQPGAVVMPAGDGLVQPSPEGPSQREGQAGAGDQPAGVLPGQASEPGGLGDGQLDGGDAGRARLPAAGRDGRVAEGYLQVSVGDVAVGRGGVRVVIAVAGGREGDAAGQRAADGGGPQLGQS